jgi:hypothetical protein
MTMTMDAAITDADIGGLVRRIRGEFLEMPGLRLTEPQAQRLWSLDPASCRAVLGSLVDTGFLTQTRDGAFVRDSEFARRHRLARHAHRIF